MKHVDVPAVLRRWASVTGVLVMMTFARGVDVQSQAANAVAQARTHLEQGEKAAGAHQYDEAIAHYNAALQLNPDYAEAYNDHGHAYHWGNKGDARAIADFTRAIELRPNYPNAYNNRGVVYMAGGNAARAIPEFDRALALKPDFRNAYINRANAHLRLLHVQSALDDFHRAGMYPERTAAFVGTAFIALIAVGVTVVRRLRGRRSDAAT